MFEKVREFFSKKPFNIFFIIFSFLSILLVLSYLIENTEKVKKISHSSFMYHLKNNDIRDIKCEDEKVSGHFDDGTIFESNVHLTDKVWDSIHDKKIVVDISDKDSSSDFTYIYGFIIFIILVVVWYFYQRNKDGSNERGGISSIFSVSKSRFKKNIPGSITTKFSDVAGAHKAKEALSDIVNFLKNPEKFKTIGAHIPKGVLLSGEPGNGKTLLARALAGEANCTFISMSASDLIEIFVGVGAARIRDLFHQARKSSPCIIFIDEIDTIGRARGGGFGGSVDEREQTLNQLLTEMDGFDQYDKPIIVVGATNMPEVLDKALLRPGRFDRVIYVPYPDEAARLELLQLATKNIPLAIDIELKEIAEMTQGLSGADIHNLVNIAALQATQQNKASITKENIEKALNEISSNKKNIQVASRDNIKEFLPQQIKTKFSDVAGLEDCKDDLKEIVAFLKNQEVYKNIGARIPKGVLMTGDPGNGKTLLARALAGEAGVPFFYASGSQFVQKYVGVGAERVRDLFQQARKHAPAIIFIDEIDAIGKRADNEGGGDSERSQTINQLLTEIDGFIVDELPIVIIGATNLADRVDPALKRAGRFDRQLYIPYPHLQDRIKILKLYAQKKKLSDEINLETIARGCAQFSSAKLELLLNEAAILAVAEGKSMIENNHVEEAKDRLLVGKKNVGLKRTEVELKKTAYHEAGHAITKILSKDYPLDFHKVTILSRGGALGISWGLPKDDMVSFSKEELYAKIMVCMAGRAAETLAFNKFCLGAYGDFQSATSIALDMVKAYGMGEKTGMVCYTKNRYVSPETHREIDLEVRTLLENAYKEVYILLEKNIAHLHNVAKGLLEKETLTAREVYEIMKIPYSCILEQTSRCKIDKKLEKKIDDNSNDIPDKSDTVVITINSENEN